MVSGDPTFTIDGQPVARVNDMVSCPRCKRMATIVSSRFPTVIAHGKPVAYDQDMTNCGAIIYSRHNNHAGWKEDNEGEAVSHIEDYIPHQAPRFQEHFILRNNGTGEPLAGVPYTIRTDDGKVYKGQTDAQGRTDVVWTDSAKPIEFIAHPKHLDNDDPYHYAGQSYEGL